MYIPQYNHASILGCASLVLLQTNLCLNEGNLHFRVPSLKITKLVVKIVSETANEIILKRKTVSLTF